MDKYVVPASTGPKRFWTDPGLGDSRMLDFEGKVLTSPQAYSVCAFGAVLAGTLRVRCAERQFEADAGSLICIAANVLNQIESVGPECAVLNTAFVPEPFVADLSIESFDRLVDVQVRVVRSWPTVERMRRVFELSWRAHTGQRSDASRSTDLGWVIDRATELPPQPALRISLRPPSEAAARARAIIEEAANSPISLKQLAEDCGVSVSYLVREFRDTYWLTPHQLIVSRRTRMGRQALDQGLNVAQAAMCSGFSDQSHFSRWFKRTYGITPGHYQRALGRTS